MRFDLDEYGWRLLNDIQSDLRFFINQKVLNVKRMVWGPDKSVEEFLARYESYGYLFPHSGMISRNLGIVFFEFENRRNFAIFHSAKYDCYFGFIDLDPQRVPSMGADFLCYNWFVVSAAENPEYADATVTGILNREILRLDILMKPFEPEIDEYEHPIGLCAFASEGKALAVARNMQSTPHPDWGASYEHIMPLDEIDKYAEAEKIVIS